MDEMTEQARLEDALRREHDLLRAGLGRVWELSGVLRSADSAGQSAAMRDIAGFLGRNLDPHLEWEVRVLLAAARSAPGVAATIAALRRKVSREVSRLTEMVRAQRPDAIGFGRRADRLLGIAGAYLELVEELVLPGLEVASPEDLQRLRADREICC